MKPRTKLQVEVFRLAQNLPMITPDQKDWAFKNCLEHIAYVTKNNANCLDCGHLFSPSLIVKKRVTCPKCQTKLTTETTKKRTLKQKTFFLIADVVGEFQVARYFQIESQHKNGHQRKLSCYEILQHWIREDGKREVIARNHTWNYLCDSWGGLLEIRDKANVKKYDVYHDEIYPLSRFKQVYSKYGINHQLKGLSLLDAIRFVPLTPRAETLLKAKQYRLLSHMQNQSWGINQFWASIRICMRNKYAVPDGSMYIDYLELLREFGKDLHNAKFVCPKNLKEAHDYYMNKKQEIQRRESLERKKQRAYLDNKQYLEDKKNFIGLTFKNKNILIKVVESVEEFIEIGDTLKHCVYSNEYYKKEDSLILSALVNGKITETIEVSIPELTIVQSRGKFNDATEFNEEIISLVNQNLSKIQKRIAS